MSRTVSFTDFELEIIRNMWYLEDSRDDVSSEMKEETIKKYDDAFENIRKKIF